MGKSKNPVASAAKSVASAVKTAASAVKTVENSITSAPSKYKRSLKVAQRSISSRIPTSFLGAKNVIIFKICGYLRAATNKSYTSIDAVAYDSTPEETLFYQTVTDIAQSAAVAALYTALTSAPAVENDDTPVDDSFYAGMAAGFTYPASMQNVNSDLECFLANYSAFCTNVNGQYVCDLSSYSKYPAQAGCLAYGGKAIVANDGSKIVSIDGVPNGATGYDVKQNVFLSTFAVHLIVIQHATITHLAVFQRLLVKYADPMYKPICEKNPKLKYLMQVLFTNTNAVSINEQALIGGPKSLVGLLTSFADDGLLDCCKHAYDYFSAMTSVDIKNALSEGVGQWPLACAQAWTASVALVNSVGTIDPAVDPNDLALLVWVANFYHTFVGDTQIVNLMKGHLPLNCTGKPHVQNTSYATVSATIAASAMTRTTSLQEIVGRAKPAQGQDNWRNLYNALSAITNTGIKDLVIGDNTSYPSVNF